MKVEKIITPHRINFGKFVRRANLIQMITPRKDAFIRETELEEFAQEHWQMLKFVYKSAKHLFSLVKKK